MSVMKRGSSYFLAMVPATILLGVIGAMASTATGVANPINAFAQMVDNKVVMIVTLAFIIFAQLTTNLWQVTTSRRHMPLWMHLR